MSYEPSFSPKAEALPDSIVTKDGEVLIPRYGYISPRQAAKSPLTVKDVVSALAECRGNISATARYLNRTRQGLKAFIDSHPEALLCFNTLKQLLLDNAEENLTRAVEAGNIEASKYMLQTHAADRGYVKPGQASASLTDAKGNQVKLVIEG